MLLKCLYSNVETQQGAAVSAPEFRKTLEDKYRYLLLVVNPTGGEKTISFKVWMEAENEVVTEAPDGLSIDDVVGTYSGESWDPVEGGAVNSHTFTVSRSGDGLMMSILEGYQWQYEPASGTATTEVYVPEYDITFNFVFHFISEGGIIRIDGYTSAEGITYTVHEYYKK